jgi:hypothetical protein
MANTTPIATFEQMLRDIDAAEKMAVDQLHANMELARAAIRKAGNDMLASISGSAPVLPMRQGQRVPSDLASRVEKDMAS